MIRKSFDAVTKVLDGDQGLVEAIVNTTGVIDLQNENLQPGCWESVCKAMAAGEISYPTILWGHEHQLPVGKVLHAEELYPGDARLKSFQAKSGAGGLRIVGQYNLETQRGREAYSDVKHELIKQWSISYWPAEDGHKYDSKGVHQVTKVGIWPEVSNVLMGASPGTHVMALKSAEEVLTNEDLSRIEQAQGIKALIQKELARDEELDSITQLELVAMLIQKWTAGEGGDEMAATPVADPAPLQLQAETTAAAQPTAEKLAEMLAEMVMERLNAPPQHSDPDDSGDDGLTFWARQNIRPNNPIPNS